MRPIATRLGYILRCPTIGSKDPGLGQYRILMTPEAQHVTQEPQYFRKRKDPQNQKDAETILPQDGTAKVSWNFIQCSLRRTDSSDASEVTLPLDRGQACV